MLAYAVVTCEKRSLDMRLSDDAHAHWIKMVHIKILDATRKTNDHGRRGCGAAVTARIRTFTV